MSNIEPAREFVAYRGTFFTIEWFHDEEGRSDALEFYMRLPEDRRRKVLILLKRMGDFGKIFDTTKFRHEGDQIYAFKPQPDRFLCFFFSGRKIVITNAFVKKSDQRRASKCGKQVCAGRIMSKESNRKPTMTPLETRSTFDREMADPSFREAFEEEYMEFTLAEVVLQLMEEEGVSVRKLAKAAGVSPTVIQDIRGGNRSNMTLHNLHKILHALGSSIAVKVGDRYVTLAE